MLIEQIAFDIDLSRKRVENLPSELLLSQVNQFDHGGVEIKLNIIEDDLPVDLTAYDVVLNVKTELGTESRVLMTGNSEGVATYRQTKGETLDAGLVSCSVSLHQDGYRRTANIFFYFMVVEDLVGDDSDIIEHDKYTILSQLLDKLNSVLNNEDARDSLFEQKQQEREDAFELSQQGQLDLFTQQMEIQEEDYQNWKDMIIDTSIIEDMRSKLEELEQLMENSIFIYEEGGLQ